MPPEFAMVRAGPVIESLTPAFSAAVTAWFRPDASPAATSGSDASLQRFCCAACCATPTALAVFVARPPAACSTVLLASPQPVSARATRVTATRPVGETISHARDATQITRPIDRGSAVRVSRGHRAALTRPREVAEALVRPFS